MFDNFILALPIALLVSVVGIFFAYDNFRQKNKTHSISKIVACLLFGLLGVLLPVGFMSFLAVVFMAIVVIICSLRDVTVAQRREQAGPQPWHW
jgi:ABC-type Fe3+ transport system permease subunit